MSSEKLRTRNLFRKNSDKPFKISRSGLELFIQCPRCFYLDKKKGLGRPSTPGYTLNSAVDALLKKEFDLHRAKNKAHPLMKAYNIKAVPFQHENMDKWRHNFTGIQFYHKKTNFLFYGAIDDLWIDSKKQIHIVDYKSTSTEYKIDINSFYKMPYRRQLEMYQWLFRKNKFKISDVGYFVYANGRKDKKAFDSKLEFDVEIISYKGSDKWVEKELINAYDCLMADKMPKPAGSCEYCKYRALAKKLEK